MGAFAPHLVDRVTAVLKAQLDGLVSSWVGIALVIGLVGLFAFPVARAIYRTSKWAAAGFGLVLVAAAVYWPMPFPHPVRPPAVADSPPPDLAATVLPAMTPPQVRLPGFTPAPVAEAVVEPEPPPVDDGINGQCPYCGGPMRLGKLRHENVRCRRCGEITGVSRARIRR